MSERNISKQCDSKTKEDQKKFPCKQCDYKATQNGNLLKHIQSVHIGVKFTCDLCDYEAKEKRYIMKHKKTKHEAAIL